MAKAAIAPRAGTLLIGGAAEALRGTEVPLTSAHILELLRFLDVKARQTVYSACRTDVLGSLLLAPVEFVLK